MNLKILFIDDQPASVESVKAETERKMAQSETKVVGFEEAEKSIDSFGPDVVVLDILQETAGEGQAVGLEICNAVWNQKFCPLVLYTAFPGRIENEEIKKHPFVKIVQKGAGSDERVVGCIHEYLPHITAIDDVRKEIRGVMSLALKEVAPRVFAADARAEERRDTLIRSARRRVAAAMDEALLSGEPLLKCWEHYLCPAVGSDLLTGDIIRRAGGEAGDPTGYAIVLTPSCDLARKPKVDAMLVARCTSVERLLEDVNLKGCTNLRKIKDRVEPVLGQGHSHSCLPLPEYSGVFPSMVADFRKLVLVKIEGMTDGEYTYERIASVDSPFRELVAWAYLSNAARPGLPERDVGSWADEIVDALKQDEKAGGG